MGIWYLFIILWPMLRTPACLPSKAPTTTTTLTTPFLSLTHSLYIAAWALSVIGGASTLGRVLLGWCGDSVGHMRVLRVSVLALAVAMAAWSLTSNMAGIYSFAFAWGFFAGAFISVLPVVLAEFFGADRMASVSGLVYNGFAIGGFLP